MLKKLLLIVPVILLFCACDSHKEAADLIVHHGKIYTVDSTWLICDAMAIKNGKIIGIGSNEMILEKFEAAQTEDLAGKTVFPGFIDAHCHFLAYGLGLGRVDLTGTQSFAEVISRVRSSAEKNIKPEEKNSTHPLPAEKETSWIIGRGWDQNDWKNQEMPNRSALDSLFPTRPVIFTRVDGHAALVNGAALRIAGITEKTKINGGEIVLKNHVPTGLLVDNAIELVKNHIPPPSLGEKSEALLNAQSACLAEGLTTVDDAGLMKDEVDLIDKLQHKSQLKIRVYAMLSDSGPNYKYYLDKGPYKTERLNVRSFKFYGDGALGSRGACLYEPYADKHEWRGFLLSSPEHFAESAELMAVHGFQMNTHCIGDSAFGLLVNIYGNYCTGDNSKRWRIEHAQITAGKDLKKLNRDIIPSVQPTHATSDMYWAGERLGKERVKTAYAYLDLLNASGIVALGTDFPVEDISPFKTFYAAVCRKDNRDYPPGGFQKMNALSRQQTLKGMTIWAAWANFEETEKGSLEKGKFADFIVVDTDIMKCAENDILHTKVVSTYINGEKVYSATN